MNPGFPNGRFPHAAPIPHQFAMKVFVDTWIYVTEKFGNMGFDADLRQYGKLTGIIKP